MGNHRIKICMNCNHEERFHKSNGKPNNCYWIIRSGAFCNCDCFEEKELSEK